jgi:hypothetical protein
MDRALKKPTPEYILADYRLRFDVLEPTTMPTTMPATAP